MTEAERELYGLLRELNIPQGRMDVTNVHNLRWMSRNLGLNDEDSAVLRAARIKVRALLKEHRTKENQ